MTICWSDGRLSSEMESPLPRFANIVKMVNIFQIKSKENEKINNGIC